MRKRWVYIVLGLLAIVIVVELPQVVSETTYFTSYLSHLLFENNQHTVVPGRLYRTGEMDDQDFQKTLEKHHIKTIIDLRVSDKELALPPDSDVQVLPVRMVGSKIPGASQVVELLGAFDKAIPPVLVMCKSGTHRSGVVSTLWLLDQEGADIEAATEQLSTRYGFVKAERKLKSVINDQLTIDNLIWAYANAAKESNQSFRDWFYGLSSDEYRTLRGNLENDDSFERLPEDVFERSRVRAKLVVAR